MSFFAAIVSLVAIRSLELEDLVVKLSLRPLQESHYTSGVSRIGIELNVERTVGGHGAQQASGTHRESLSDDV